MNNIGFVHPASGSGYNSVIEGNIGRFLTPAGEVIFLQTRARLSRGDISSSARLTSLLIPAREALDVREMDFNQLLQRDLDDHRIAHELVPYILKPQETGPAFFPPILAALLPFEDRRPKSTFPPLVSLKTQEDPMYPGAKWNMSKVGDVFCLQEHVDANGNLDPLGVGVLRWNDELSKLVIMDGQHRAMALLAIHRTIANSWGATSSSGERYRSFYETKIREIMQELEECGGIALIDKLEFPVTICIFPGYTGEDKNPHIAARKLFIDVNKEAKPPSESRLILLSDIRLDHVLSRELLNHLRSSSNDDTIPLYAVEYDNPEPRTTTPRRWSAVTNLEIFLKAVEYCCFGPSEVVSGIDKLTKVIGKPNKRLKNSYFRGQMRLQDLLENTIPDGPRNLDRAEIGLDQFPIYNKKAKKVLLDRFFDLWGKGLLRLFSEVEPYKAHIYAVRSMLSGWLGGNITGDLAREALFEGVGMFWTLEKGHEHWREQVRTAKELKKSEPVESEVSKAWRIVDNVKKEEFERERCRVYLGKTDSDSIKHSKEFYAVAITYAAQVGLALTWALLRHLNPTTNPDNIVTSIINSINKSLTTGPVHSRDRKLIFRKEENNAFNLIQKLDSPFAAYFRVFWLELILIDHNHDSLRESGVNIDSAMSCLREGRKFYANKIIDDHIQSHKRTGDYNPEECINKGKASAIKALSNAYHKWIGMTTNEANSYFCELLSESDNEDIDDDEYNSEEEVSI